MRRRVPIAFDAVQPSTNEAESTIRRGNPRSDLPGRVVTDVLGVAALEVRNPVLLFVLVEANDAALHQSVRGVPGPGRISR